MTDQRMDPREHYRICFALAKPRLAQAGDEWLGAIRAEALERFAQAGFPTTKEEEWKYTNVEPLARIPFKPASSSPSHPLSFRLATPPAASPGDARIVFVNGSYRCDLSSPGDLEKEGVVSNFKAAMDDGKRGLVAEHLTRHASYTGQPFVALNTAFLSDGVFVFIPPATVLARPIHLIFLSLPGPGPALSHPRTLIVADRESRAAVLEHYAGVSGAPYFTNAVTEIALAQGASLDHLRLVREQPGAFHVSTVQARQERNSYLRSYSFSLGGALVRNDSNTLLAGEGARCQMSGLYLATGSQHVDNHTRIEHAAASSTSEESYNGVLGGTATGVFNGKVIVQPQAQKTNAEQRNRNLLLSPDAVINTKPQLEIFADDVKCTHAATVGRIDEEALFYLRSRGLARASAKRLLIHAFAGEVIAAVGLKEVKNALTEAVSEILASDDWVEER